MAIAKSTHLGARIGLHRWLALAAVLLLAAAAIPRHTRAADKPDPAGIEFFEKKIRPMLIAQCYSCHSVEAKKHKGGLLLDSKAAILKGGDSGPALVPGKPAESLILKAVRQADELKMPPKSKLSDEIIADLEKWIAQGAPDPRDGAVTSTKRFIDIAAGRSYWAFKPLVPPAVPPIKHDVWARNPIDRFILAKLEEKKLAPNPAVGKEKLIRRAYFDLWGIPPSRAEIDAFLKDDRADAYEKLVEHLLAGEHYGERWARHWLDAVRFAESGGYEFDKDRPGAYHYRDFVIRALNQDMPYDEFVRLQTAGDHLQRGDFQANAATGFLVAGPYPGQTTAKTLAIIRYDHLDDMLSTIGTSMLGLSLGCARCHEHKYDPIPQEDYYRLLATLARTDSSETKLDPNPEIYRQARAAFDQAHAPLLKARDSFDREQLPARLEKWLEQNGNKDAPPWQTLDLVSAVSTSKMTQFQKREDGSVFAVGQPPNSEVFTFTFHTYQKGIQAIRVEALAEPSLVSSGPGRGPDGNFMLTEINLAAAPLAQAKAKATPVKLINPRATFEPENHRVAAALEANKKTGWSVAGQVGKDHAAVFETEGGVGFDGGTVLTLTLKFEAGHFAIGRPRISIATAPRPEKLDGAGVPQHGQELRTLIDKEKGQITDQNRAALTRWYRGVDPEANKLYAAVEEHLKVEPQPKLVPAFIASSGKGGDVHFLVRGEVDRKQYVPKPGFMQVLMTSPDQDQRWTGELPAKGPPPVEPRVALARWLTDSEQGAGHLLARVIVNRLWQHHMGKGIVATPNDFGVQGEPPTHPELLDFLAAELIRGGWKLKPIHQLIMTSAVYRESGEPSEAALKTDPGNRLWWRRPARRLEAEAIRDSLLAVSGSLDPAMFGPGTLDENSNRRSVYLMVKRSRLVPMMQMYDAPEAIQSIGVRSTTTVATQALAMMNSPFVRKRAEQFAQRVRPKDAADLPKAVEDAYGIGLGRKPTDAERARMLAFIDRQVESYGKTPKALDQALADCCQVLLCSNEFVYVD